MFIDKLSKNASHRWAMLRTMATQLLQYGRIETTLPKARQLSKVADRLITYAKRGTAGSRMQATRIVRSTDMIDKLFKEIAPRYTHRDGGYTRVLRSRKRYGDNATMAFIEYVDRYAHLGG